jgi:hypothetical protein
MARPRAEVAALAAAPANAPLWFVAHFLGRQLAYTYEVVEFIEGERLVMRTAEGPFPMEPDLRAKVEQSFPGLQWESRHRASAVVRGNWYEVHLPETATSTLSVRCSLQVDHGEFVQALCDRFGWLAFDEQPQCFQPHRAPFPA